MPTRRAAIAAAIAAAAAGSGLVAAVAVGGSNDGNPGDSDPGEARVVQPGAPGEEGRELSEEDLAGLDPPAHTPTDTGFMQGMIAHHRQALEMTALVEGRHESEDLPLLAERIEVSQTDEIAQMERWLTERGEEVPEAGHAQHELMPGMLSDDQLRELEQARGAAFDRLFLERMIAHHEGALAMVDDLYAKGGGIEPAADRFAREAEADQSIEIGRMQDLL